MGKVEVVGKYIFIRAFKEEVSSAGIIIPDTAGDTAVIMGDVIDSQVKGVSAGDRVFFRRFAGHEVEVDGEKCFFVHRKDIFGKAK